MKIEITSVSALSEGAEMLLTVRIDNGDGRAERRKLILFTEQYLELGLCRGAMLDEELFDRIAVAFLTIVLTIFYRLTERISKCKAETFHHGCQILSDSKNLNWLRTNVCKRTSDDYSSRQNALQYGLNV